MWPWLSGKVTENFSVVGSAVRRRKRAIPGGVDDRDVPDCCRLNLARITPTHSDSGLGLIHFSCNVLSFSLLVRQYVALKDQSRLGWMIEMFQTDVERNRH